MEQMVSCKCGRVQMHVVGEPFYNSACHCDDCQAGWHYVEALEGAVPVVDERGGTEYLFYRQDRVDFIKGRELLRAHKLRPDSPTQRFYAGCCNSPMYSEREKMHYLPLIRARFGPDAPPRERNHYTKFSTQQPFEGGDLPDNSGVPPRLVLKLIWVELLALF
ncbi:MAG: DUF6151 family protein [Candidatus Promineifilaceae bacterium]|nr:DUF6151 family protein [Candidatus Promineifilaceae bacterium]